MFKYVEIYGGKVRDLKESHLGYVEFCSIFDPSCYWLDVTGVEDIAIGYIIKFSEELGTYFEKPEPAVVEETLETKKAGKLEMLNAMFYSAGQNAYVTSSLGFDANAGDRALTDVRGLIDVTEENPEEMVIFCDYHNVMHPITLDELKTLKMEIIKNGQYLYQQKWQFRKAINAAETMEEVDNIIITFEYMNFIV